MIRISKDSMWYKFYTEGRLPHAMWDHERLPSDLCTFMRRVLAGILMTFWTLAAATALLLSAFVLFPLTWFIPDLLVGDLYGAVETASVVVYATTLVAGGYLLIDYLTDVYDDYQDRKLEEASMYDTKLLSKYRRAIKDKVCPLITYEGEAS